MEVKRTSILAKAGQAAGFLLVTTYDLQLIPVWLDVLGPFPHHALEAKVDQPSKRVKTLLEDKSEDTRRKNSKSFSRA
jgi:hypothetical protein